MINKITEDLKKKIKRIKTMYQKQFAKLQKIKNIQSEIKPIKIGKKPGTTYYFGCKDFTHNFRPQETKTTNKVLREKSNCCLSIR